MKKLQKINVIALWVVSILIVLVNSLLGAPILLLVKSAVTMIATSLLSTIIYRVKMNERIQSVIISSLAALATLVCSILLGGNSQCIFIAFITLAVVTLYMDKTILLLYGSIYGISAIAVYKINPVYISGQNMAAGVGVIYLGIYLILVVILYNGTARAHTLIQTSEEASKKANEYKVRITNQTELVKNVVGQVQDSVETSYHEAGSLSEEAGVVVATVESFVSDQKETADTLVHLKETTQSSNEKINNNYRLASDMKVEYAKVMKALSTVSEESENFNRSMVDIVTAIKESVDSANDMVL